jgi:hypothetical protein
LFHWMLLPFILLYFSVFLSFLVGLFLYSFILFLCLYRSLVPASISFMFFHHILQS